MDGAQKGQPAFMERMLMVGPDPPEPGDPNAAGVAPWWLRLLAVATAAGVGAFWSSSSIGQELAWGLNYGVLVAVSLAASHWKLIFVVNLVLSLAWLLIPLRRRDEHPHLWRLSHVVTFLNRQVGHLEAAAIWLTLAIGSCLALSWQLTCAAAVLFLGGPIVNGIARVLNPGARKTDGTLYWARRSVIYAFTVFGIILVAARACSQMRKLLPLTVAILVGGTFPRYLRLVLRNRRVKEESSDPVEAAKPPDEQQSTLRSDYRKVQIGWPMRLDKAVPALAVIGMVIVLIVAWRTRQQYDARLRAIDAAETPDATGCVREPGGPTRVDLSVFIVSDSQLHELQGQRFPGQVDLAEAFVPVAVRPVELDLLSAATLWRFGSDFAHLATDAAQAGQPMLWAHLGDFGDLGCDGEIRRMAPLFEHFSKAGRLAGIAPGNHDKSFTGNFFWSPFWDKACRKRIEKLDSDALLREMTTGLLAEGARMMPVEAKPSVVSRLTRRGSALVTVTPLGLVHDRGKVRGLVGVFLDTADEEAFDFGIAGEYGTLSEAQVDTLLRLASDLRQSRPDTYGDPLYVLFEHHPLGSLTRSSQKAFERLLFGLNADVGVGVGAKPSIDLSHVLVLIAAHTHLAETVNHCIAHRRLRELIVGSTIDPPQEASLLTVGPDADGIASVRLRTLPAVARENKTCGSEGTLAALDCQQIMGELERAPECRPLFRESGGLSANCPTLERSMTLTERLEALSKATGTALSPEGIKAAQAVRAGLLLSCICRGKTCTPPPAALDLNDDQGFMDFLVDHLSKVPSPKEPRDWQKELACLSWAGSSVQAHKASGMTVPAALRCAFSDTTLPSAKDYTQSLEATECL